MIKSTLFLSTLILLLASCSDDSLSDKLQGDNYSATILCTSPALGDGLTGVSIEPGAENEFTITYGGQYGSMIGSIDDNDNLTILPYNTTLDDGTVLDYVGGSGEFRIDTIMNTSTPIKVLGITMDDENGQACLFNLFEEE